MLVRWACTPDGPVLHGGVGLIVPVRMGTSGLAVLKVSFPHPGNVHEPDAFAAWDGRAAVRLYGRNDERFAMLLERAQARPPDVILLDIGLPKQNGLQAVRQIRKHTPESKILFLSQESDPEIVQEALNLGASGYVAKMVVAKEELIAATRAVLRGEQFISGILAGDLLRRQSDTLPP